MKVIWLILMVLAAGVAELRADTPAPDLTDTQRQMLAVVEDYTGEIDGPGLYALFEAGAGDGDAVGIDAVVADPAGHRGGLVEVTGELARVREMGLSRVVKGGQTAWEWSVVTDDGQVVVVYVAGVRPHGVGQRIQVVGRFYKIWRDRDQAGKEQDYMVLVAGDQISEIEVAAGATSGGSRGMSDGLIIIAAVVLLWLTLRRVRALAEKRDLRARVKRYGDSPSHAHGLGDAGDVVAGSKTAGMSAAEALKEMDRRNDRTGREDS